MKALPCKVSCLVFLILLLLFPLLFLSSEETTVSFTIAPPPVGYPEFTPGPALILAGGNGIFISSSFNKPTESGSVSDTLLLFGAGGFADYQKTLSTQFAFGAKGGASLLVGDNADIMMGDLPGELSLLVQPVNHPLLNIILFASAGGSLGSTRMTIPMPTAIVDIYDETSYSVTSLSWLGKGGLQLSLKGRLLVFSPYALYSISGGSYWTSQSSSLSYTYPSTSGTIDPSSSLLLGFDLLYRPENISLGAQLKQNPLASIFSLSLKQLLP